MKQVERSAQRMVLEARPVALGWGLLVAFVVFTALAVVVFRMGSEAWVLLAIFAFSVPVYVFFFLETRQLILDRGEGAVILRRKALQGQREARHPLAGLQRAEAQAPRKAGATGQNLRRAVLVYEDGAETPLSDGYSKGAEPAEIAEAINLWLAAA